MPRYRNQPDPLAGLAARARARGVDVYLALDCLHWADADTSAADDLLARQPDLAERDHEGGFGRPADGKYASPFHPRVRAALRELVQEVAGRYPAVDGVVLDCRLPPGGVLGYSAAARAAFRTATKQAPPAWPLEGGPEGARKAGPWLAWRTAECTALVRELSSAYRAGAPKGRVAATGPAAWYRAPLPERLAVPMDWLTWAAGGAVDELLLDADWAAAGQKDLYRACEDLVRRIRKPVRLSAVLPAVEGPAAEAAVRALLCQDVAGVVVRPGPEGDLDTAGRLLGETLPQIEASPLDVEESHLQADPRLQAKLTRDLRRPSVGQVLALLREAAGQPLPADDAIDLSRPAFDSLVLHNQPAWQVMRTLAGSKAVRGHWVRVGKEYRLVGSSPPDDRPHDAPAGTEPMRWRVVTTVSCVTPLLALGALLLWRVRQASRHAARPEG
jgi:hypothetical protein